MEPNEFGHAETDEPFDRGSLTEPDEETPTDDDAPSVEEFTEIVNEQRRRRH
jgi:hypothetical protein